VGAVITWHPLAILGWCAATACIVAAGLLFARVLDALDEARASALAKAGEDGAGDFSNLDHGGEL
jgi:hypothetical protein